MKSSFIEGLEDRVTDQSLIDLLAVVVPHSWLKHKDTKTKQMHPRRKQSFGLELMSSLRAPCAHPLLGLVLTLV